MTLQLAIALCLLAGVGVVACGGVESRTQPTSRAEARALLSDWGVAAEYPFRSEFLEAPNGRMHYVDEGGGAPVLAVHGNPTWSFLYRHVVRGLRDGNRVVAPDLIGFGLSEKPSSSEQYTAESHVDDVDALMVELDLQDVTIVVQDWGGPIGLGVASRHPDRVRALVIMNTTGFYPLPGGSGGSLALRLIAAPGVGELLVGHLAVFERLIMPRVFAKPERYSAVMQAYRGPFSSAAERAGIVAFPRLIPRDPSDASARLLGQHVQPFLRDFAGPVLIIWGEQDPVFGPAFLQEWRDYFPEARTVLLPGASHYLQEDAHEEIVPAIASFLRDNGLRAATSGAQDEGLPRVRP